MVELMHTPSPHDIGLPAKFSEWRANQPEALHFLRTSTKRVKALCAPTGFGKTSLYVADALQSGEPTCFVTDRRPLQDQLMGDCASIGMVDIRGRNNYTCKMKGDDTGYTCEEGYSARCPFKGSVRCPASLAEIKAASSFLVVTNYSKWIAAKKFGQGMSHFKRVVFDEGHEAPNALAKAMQVTLHHKEIEQDLGLDFPTVTLPPTRRDFDPAAEAAVFHEFKVWAAGARVVAEQAMIAWKRKIDQGSPKAAWIRHFTHMRNLTRKLAIVSTAAANNWVVDDYWERGERVGYQFDPIWAGRYAESSLLLGIPTITVISATLRPKTLAMMGVSKEHYDFREFNSDFDPRRCPVYWVQTMRVDYHSGDLGMLWIRHDQMAAKRRDRNGIVHTVSFARRDDIYKRSRFAQSMIINEQGEPATEMVEAFKSTYPGAILVSPSVGQGFDFPGKECEWQFMTKIPHPPPSKVLRARTHQDREYPAYIAIQKLVQAFGRGMRSKTDQCENVIADDHMEWFYPKYKHLAPKSFRSVYQPMTVLPQPPPRLA